MDPQQTQNSSGMMNGMPPMPKQERKIGPMVGALIIVVILIIAALYFFSQRMSTSSPVEDVQQQAVSAPVTPEPAAAASADSTAAIEQDLNATLPDVDYSF